MCCVLAIMPALTGGGENNLCGVPGSAGLTYWKPQNYQKKIGDLLIR